MQRCQPQVVKTPTCKSSLARICEGFLQIALPSQYDPEVVHELKCVQLLLDVPAASLDKQVAKSLTDARALASRTGTLPNMFVVFPLHGDFIIKAADSRLKDFDSMAKSFAKVSETTKIFQALPNSDSDGIGDAKELTKVLASMQELGASSLESMKETHHDDIQSLCAARDQAIGAVGSKVCSQFYSLLCTCLDDWRANSKMDAGLAEISTVFQDCPNQRYTQG